VDSIKTTRLYSEKIKSKRLARIFAVQALYSFEAGCGPDVNVLILDVIELNTSIKKSKALNTRFLSTLVKGTIASIEALDQKLSLYLAEDWELHRIPQLVKNILRVALFELTHSNDLPSAVIINEYLEIAKFFIHEEDVGFMNGVLDSISKERQALESA